MYRFTTDSSTPNGVLVTNVFKDLLIIVTNVFCLTVDSRLALCFKLHEERPVCSTSCRIILRAPAGATCYTYGGSKRKL